jgi:ketosteroid isomerase-like protein
MSQENVEVVRRFYEGLNSGVPEAASAISDDVLATVFAPAIELRQLADIAGTSGTFRGYEGLRESWRELHEGLQDLRWEPFDHAANGDLVAFAVKFSAIGRTSGAPVNIRVGHLFELRAGRIVRLVVYARPEEALKAVGQRK